MKKIFSKEKINSGRQIEIDLAKCMSIIFMIFLHCLMVTGGFNNTINPSVQKLIGQLLGEPFAAPVFMFSMGIGIVYSRHQESHLLIKRGIKLMLLGILVNVGEFVLPHYLAGHLLGKWDIFPIAGGLLLFCVDILAFAGLAMITIGILKKLNLSTRVVVLIAIIMSILGSLLRFTDFGSNVGNLIAGYFIGSAGGFTAFPLFNWFIFPATGMLFGEYYIHCKDKTKFLLAWPLTLIIAIVYFVMSWSIPNGFLAEVHHYYFMTLLDAFFCILCIYGVIGFWYFTSKILPKKVLDLVSKTSKNLNEIYIIQWFLIPLTYIFIAYFKKDIVFGNLSLLIISIIELLVAATLANCYNILKNKKGGNL